MSRAQNILEILKVKSLDDIYPELTELLDSGDQEALFDLLELIERPLYFPLIRTLDMLACRFENRIGRQVSAIAVPVFMNGNHKVDANSAAQTFTRSGLENSSSSVEVIPTIFQINAVKNLLPGQIRQLNKKLLGLDGATELKLPFTTPDSFVGYGIVLGFITRKESLLFRDFPEATLYKWRDQFEAACPGLRVFAPQENWALAIAEAAARDILTPAHIAIDKCRTHDGGKPKANIATDGKTLHLHLMDDKFGLMDMVVLEDLWVDMEFAIAELGEDLGDVSLFDTPAQMPKPQMHS